jgi:KEOPS complex subunit Cgi121
MSVDPTMFEIRAAHCSIDDMSAFLLRLKEISLKFDTHIICFNADMLAGRKHAESAALHAIRSFREGHAISNTLEMEALLYAAGSRQCSIAVSFGLRAGENRLWVCCYPSGEETWETLSTVLNVQEEDFRDCIDQQKQERLMQIFGITPEELASLGNTERIADLVLERVALLDVLR